MNGSNPSLMADAARRRGPDDAGVDGAGHEGGVPRVVRWDTSNEAVATKDSIRAGATKDSIRAGATKDRVIRLGLRPGYKIGLRLAIRLVSDWL